MEVKQRTRAPRAAGYSMTGFGIVEVTVEEGGGSETMALLAERTGRLCCWAEEDNEVRLLGVNPLYSRPQY